MAERPGRRAKAEEPNSELSIRKRRQGRSPAKAPEQLREERLGEEEKKQDLSRTTRMPLKQGAGTMGVGGARLLQVSLRNLLERHRHLFRAFHAIVEGRGTEVSKEHRRDLKRWYFIRPDGSPNPAYKAVLTAALITFARSAVR